MTFDEVLAQVQDLLQQEKRVSYRGLKRRFALDDEYLEDLKVGSLNLPLFVARKNWLKSRDSPPYVRTNSVKIEALHRDLRGHMHIHCDQLQTLIN